MTNFNTSKSCYASRNPGKWDHITTPKERIQGESEKTDALSNSN